MKYLYLALLFLLPILSIGQKVDLDRYNFTVQVRTLPQMRLDSSYHTYNVVVEGTKLMQSYLQDMDPEKSVIVDGWKSLSTTGHITFRIKLEDLLPESVSVKERVENIKDKTGKITGTRIFYYQEVVYTFAALAQINDYKGEHIMDIVLADRGHKQTYKSPEFPIRQVAEGYFMINALSVTGNLYKSCVTRAMHTLSNQASNNFGYSEATISDFMWILDSRKHPEYTAHREAFQQITEVLFTFNASQSIDGVREKLQPVINYFEKIKKTYTSTKKYDRKLRYASYFNLAVLYYYLDDPQSMLKEAKGLVMNDYDANDGRVFENSALRLKNLFQSAKIYTRHFPIDPTTFKGPYETEVTKNK